MATSAYPHMIFATEAAGLDKDRLAALLDEAVPGGESEPSSIKLTWTREGYRFTFWFEDADRVGEMYADYLPEGARRRPVVNATTVIDMSGEADPEGAHEADARTIVTRLAEQDGVHVFSESSKRFVGLSYGDEPAAQADVIAAAAQVPGPAVPMPDPVAAPPADAPVTPEVEHVEPGLPEPVDAPEPLPEVAPVAPAPVIDEPDFLSPRAEPAPAPDFLEPKPVADAAPDFLEAEPEREAPVEQRVESRQSGDFGEPGVSADAPTTPDFLEPKPVADEAADVLEPTAEPAPAPETPRMPGQVAPVPDAEPVQQTVAEPASEPSEPEAWAPATEQSGARPGDEKPAQPEERGFFKRLFGRR